LFHNPAQIKKGSIHGGDAGLGDYLACGAAGSVFRQVYLQLPLPEVYRHGVVGGRLRLRLIDGIEVLQ
jgi:hypothetical protein